MDNGALVTTIRPLNSYSFVPFWQLICLQKGATIFLQAMVYHTPFEGLFFFAEHVICTNVSYDAVSLSVKNMDVDMTHLQMTECRTIIR